MYATQAGQPFRGIGSYQPVACAEVKNLLLHDMVSLPVAFSRLGAFSVRSWNQPPSYEVNPGKLDVRFDMGQASENDDQKAHILLEVIVPALATWRGGIPRFLFRLEVPLLQLIPGRSKMLNSNPMLPTILRWKRYNTRTLLVIFNISAHHLL
jgi:hypothetical protein